MLEPDTKMNWPTDRQSQYNMNWNSLVQSPCGGGLEYLHRR
jgi:hypothetical protein